MTDGVKVVVPDRLDLITPYVLREQGDWFEDEIKFVRKLAHPGMSCIDVGANYGVYALSLARKVGPAGRVWAFEPAAATAGCLRASIGANRFENVTLLETALSDRTGTALLAVGGHAELNHIATGEDRQSGSGTPTREVSVTTLDRAMRDCGWPQIDFVKLDAEGEETRIVRGGAGFFAEQSPLVLFEIRHANRAVDPGISRALGALGYDAYELCAGLDLLVPVDLDAVPDVYRLNWFACKPERAESLARAGWLVPPSSGRAAPPALDANAGWHALAAMPYAPSFAERWPPAGAREPASLASLLEIIALHAFARSPVHPPATRWAAARSAADRIAALRTLEPRPEILSTYARIAADLGRREAALVALTQAARAMAASSARLTLPLLPASPRFDEVDPESTPERWAFAAVLEQMETLRQYSAIFGSSSSELIDLMRSLGFSTPAMEARKAAMQARTLASVLS